MKILFETDACFINLSEHIKKHLTPKLIRPLLHRHQRRNRFFISQEDSQLDIPQQLFQENRAAKIIQQAWRIEAYKKAFAQAPYSAYISLLAPTEPRPLLSSIMFGRHVAEIDTSSSERIENPFITALSYYHREDDFSGILQQILLEQFNVTPEEASENEYLPIFDLKQLPVEPVIASFKTTSQIRLLTQEAHSIKLVGIPKNLDLDTSQLIKEQFRAYGLVASPWEIALNIFHSPVFPAAHISFTPIPHLPATKEDLLKSKRLDKLNFIANSQYHPTRQLAKCIKEIVTNLPDLSPAAIQRIALMFDLTHTYYEYDYARYSFFVYILVHEISLSFARLQDPNILRQYYEAFYKEAETTFKQCLGLEDLDLPHSMVTATPAVSGTNAYAVAMSLAKKMQKSTVYEPIIKIIDPCYYEFACITEDTIDDEEPDIFVLSAGPITDAMGIYPGTDINRFVRDKIIATKRTSPVCLVIDATTALYKNLSLDAEVKALVEEGRLSLIIHESHQKFGLIHTDQAQYGRMFAVCSTLSFNKADILALQQDSQEDFSSHVDLITGAFLSVHCSQILEKIKKQHFRNGTILRSIFSDTALEIEIPDILTHKYMLPDLDELYFLFLNTGRLPKDARKLFTKRDSFGHFATSRVKIFEFTRVSPGASDSLDAIIQMAQFYLAHHYSANILMDLMITHAEQEIDLSVEQQVMSLAMLNNFLTNNHFKSLSHAQHAQLHTVITHILESCPLLKGRPCFVKGEQFLLFLSQELHSESRDEGVVLA